ncbi:MAG TPA: hypothetical protein VFW00_07325, partial [Rhodocyclaceae bacterium]|nr:hypothetical protein [Rhodocyclaceae bacterium]
HKTGRKKIRVGWVSGDLRDHAVGNFVVPILEQLDRTQFESIVYYNSHISDAMSQRARQATARWHATADMSDAQLAARIRQDDVHLLIDLAGHTDGSRLQVFAHRPAPVQATWLGYPSTTGLTSMDYVLVPPDPILLAGGWCSETPLALPDCYCARDASQLSTEAMLAQPCDANGFITFGCLNNFAKVSPSAVATWARILDEVPDARLILVATGGTDDELVSDIRARFETLGVAAARLDIRSRMNLQTYRAAYREIDIGLDPFPFNGGTTGFDSLCMGAPFITLEGLGLHARMGGNLLRVIGLHELIASTVDDYVAKAVALASRREELRQIRVDLPQRMRASPLLDIKRFAHGLEQVFHKILR